MPPLAPTLTAHFFPTVDQKLCDLLLVAAGALLVALLAQVRIPLPFTPVPLTGHTFGVLLVGAVLGSKRGFASLGLYTGLGLAGWTVFAGGASGLGYAIGPTGGYLLGFMVSAYIIGLLAERGLERNFRTSLLPFMVGTLLIYALGSGWLAFYVGPQAAISKGVLPFLPGDLVKLVLAALTLPAAWKITRYTT